MLTVCVSFSFFSLGGWEGGGWGCFYLRGAGKGNTLTIPPSYSEKYNWLGLGLLWLKRAIINSGGWGDWTFELYHVVMNVILKKILSTLLSCCCFFSKIMCNVPINSCDDLYCVICVFSTMWMEGFPTISHSTSKKEKPSQCRRSVAKVTSVPRTVHQMTSTLNYGIPACSSHFRTSIGVPVRSSLRNLKYSLTCARTDTETRWDFWMSIVSQDLIDYYYFIYF